MSNVTLVDIQNAAERIKGTAAHTPLNHSRSASEWLGSEVHFKLENQQTTGSFKIRGALNKILSLSPEERARGIVASSAGNHAQGVAFSATRMGAKARIVMPVNSPLIKVMATQSYGAEIVLYGQHYDEAYAHAKQLEREKGYTFVHAFNDPMTIAGQGTLGLELIKDLPDLDSVVVPIGGGGLISGVATAVKVLRPSCKIYGVVSSQATGMMRLFKGQKIDEMDSALTIADGIAVKKPTPEMHKNYISRLVDDIIAVNDDEIAEAIVWLLERAKTVVEGSGATVLAAAAKAKWDLGKKTCLVLSGGNIDLNIVSMVIERGLSRKGRLARLSVVVPDRPGTLQRLTNALAAEQANVLDVKHDRLRPDLLISETGIEFLVETKSNEHIAKLREALAATGARVL
ncbi:MAG: threonine ammonia-lyase [Bdellovibrionales bacterium]